MVQVQLRLPDRMLDDIDSWIAEGRFKSRSDAIKTMVEVYLERERTRKFYEMLQERSKEVQDHPEMLIPFEE